MYQDGLKQGFGATAIGVAQIDQAKPSTWRPAAKSLDWIERFVILALYGWMVYRFAANCPTSSAAICNLLLLSEGVVMFLVMIRRSTTVISQRPVDWLMAFTATTAPLLVQPGGKSLLPAAVAASMIMAGFVTQVLAKLSLGRSFGCVAANRGLKFGGPYRFVRHPMYLGYLLTHVAFVCVNPTPWNFCIYALCYAIQIPRLQCEERLLLGDPQYQEYAKVVRFRLIPGVF